MGGYEGILSMEINDLVDFCIWIFFSIFIPNICHPTQSLTFFTYTHCMVWMKVCKSYHFQCMCGHCMGYSQHPKIECPRFAKLNKKQTTPKRAYAP